MHKYPKILIIGQPFNNYSGGGITLTNLFKGWPKDKLAVAATGHVLYDISTDVCNLYYQLGEKEQKWIFPFNLVQKSFSSGIISFESKLSTPSSYYNKGLRYLIVNHFFFPLLKWLGIFQYTSRITLSPVFKDWLSVYQPDLLYFQISSHEEILFATKLIDLLNIPSAIHMMDDWPSTICSKGIFKNYGRTRIDKAFRRLLDKIDIHLSISDAMSAEYFIRYHKRFIPFHNPIDIAKYNNIRNRSAKRDNNFRILYIGRIGVANKHSIISFANAMSQFSQDQDEVCLDIFTHNLDEINLKHVANIKNIRIFPPVEHNLVPALLSEYDLLLLPLDFTKEGAKFAQFSIPTKASEYMISGTPILVFAPNESAISKFCLKNECGYCLISQDQEKIIDAIHYLITNEEYRKEISNNAVGIAKELFDADKVRNKFQQLLIDTAK
jgi:glycosyltransferase involved in cell wall biosynthesis